MNRRYSHILIFLVLLGALASTARAQLVRYVRTDGTYTSSGLSWDDAKNNLQDAINELHNYMQQQGISEGGCIYVAEGTYVPTESTEISGGGVLFTAFKMYAGINVYGGYVGNETGDALLPENRVLKDGATKPWELKHETILSGNHSRVSPTSFKWNPTKQTYDTSFPGNSYHVVWFATEGLDAAGRANPLGGESLLDGFTIEGGNASNRSVDTRREHNAFGGGVYMVDGAQVKRCIVRMNEATRRGGGIYMDGGGEVDFCYFHTNQCLGLGIVAGYGGGVCIESKGMVQHSVIHNNTARVGGGAALSAEGVEGSDCYNPAMKGCVISNNTATTEGGGLLLFKGGQVNHLTVVRNKCTGPNVVVQGRRYGRSAGIYLDKTGIVTNTVMWGGEVEANSDAQYAAHTQESTDKYKPYLNYTAISNHDFADWTATSKLEVMAIGTTNEGLSGHYPNFKKGSDGVEIEDIPAGVEDPADDVFAPETRWVPLGYSPLRDAGVRQADFIISEVMLPSSISNDMDGTKFLPRTTIGAYASLLPKYVPVLMTSLEDGSKKAYTFFLDPNRSKIDLSEAEYIGHSWEQPMGKINDVFRWWNEHKGKTIRYFDGPDATATVEAPLPDDATVQILVKAGTCSTAGNYFSDAMRSGYIQLKDNSHLFGGFPEAATGRSTEGRDPVKNQTTISANIINNGYHFNSAHIIGFGGASNAVVDGFRLAYAYSLPNRELNESVGPESPIYYEPLLRDGGAILIQDKVGPVGPMTGNKVRNCNLANCTSERGAAIFVESSRSDVEIQVDFENCIIHNNTSTFDTAGRVQSAVYVGSEAGASVRVNFDHCDFLKNVGYGLHVTGAGTDVRLDNSMVWANATRDFARSEELEDNLTYLSPILVENSGRLSGSYNLLDKMASIPTGLTATQNILTYRRTQTADGETTENRTYPVFVNATKNIGASGEGDQTEYGGVINFMPRNMNPMVNAASDEGMNASDMTTHTPRNYGGAADIGAVENHEDATNEDFQPRYGSVIYVRDYGNTTEKGGDGSSWEKAINGNCTLYVNDHGFKGVDAELYPEGTELTGLQWAVDEAFYRSLEKNADGTIRYNTDKKAYTGADMATATTTTKQKEQPLTLSTVDHTKTVEVWVAAGEYLRREGFFMRNSVQVYGGFPAQGNPGMAERNPRGEENNTIIETNTNEEIENGTFEWGPKVQDVARNGSQSIFGFQPIDKTGWDVVAFSSEASQGEGTNGFAKWVIDGDENTYWHSEWAAGNGLEDANFPHQITVDMKTLQNFRYMQFLQSSDENRWMRNLTVEISSASTFSKTDAQMNWVKVFNGDTKVQLRFNLDLGQLYTARFFRITINRKLSASQEPVFKRINEIYLFENESDMEGVLGVYDLNNYQAAYLSRRVLTQPFPYYVGTFIAGGQGDPGNMEFDINTINPFDVMTSWDGFTIRNGRTAMTHSRDGGAGVAVRTNGRIINCVVENNINKQYYRLRGGGIFSNEGEIANCIVRNNQLVSDGAFTTEETDIFGGGLYLRKGRVYNTCFAGNVVQFLGEPDTFNEYVEGGAVFFENGEFYNNTITGNMGAHALRSGNWFNNGRLYMYNTLIYNNDNRATDKKAFSSKSNTVVIKNCMFESEDKVPEKNYGAYKNTFVYDANNPFVDAAHGDYSIKGSSLAVNAGLDDPADLEGIVLPEFDAVYADRIQDCRVDIGAYEYNGAYSISPATATGADGVVTATYYVTGPGSGTSSAADPAHAACMQKLQKVLDAAGRYKFAHPGEQVIVKLAAVAGGGYAPSRSSVADLLDQERENPRTYSLMVPRGVEVWGGYTDDFQTRDVIANKTVLTGAYTSDGQNVNCYHVVTFTNDLFDENGEKIGSGHTVTALNGMTNPTLDPAISTATDKLDPTKDRAILDGLYIEKGDASGEIVVAGEDRQEENTNRYGGAAIVTGYAHVRNCILSDNAAAYGGGALMLEEGALVSGCVFEKNSAMWGGAVYVKQNQDKDFDPRQWSNIRGFAHLYSCTIVDNTAHDAGGGIWFNDNVRVNSTVVWHNISNNSANVCGQIDPYSTMAEMKTSIYYPFTHSAIENLRVPGMNNISVNTDERKGVRFDITDDDPYYYLRYYSVLARAGMEVASYIEQHNDNGPENFYYPTLETVDLAGNSRITYDKDASGKTIPPAGKDFIEIGARAYNAPLMVTPTADNLMTRLYVTRPEDVNDEVFDAMADAGTYVQGSSFAFPLQTLDDALHYVQMARLNLGNERVMVDDPDAVGQAEKDGTCYVRNVKFEIFVGSGTHYPYRTVSGQYNYSRGNTFLVPEGVSIYGGFRGDIYYAQHKTTAGTDAPDETLTLGEGVTVTLKHTNTFDILSARELEDLNHNSIMEPWEMKHQTILSGKSVNSEAADNVYHVITCIADENYVGTLPNPTERIVSQSVSDKEVESTGISIVLDGLQIQDGKAMGYDPSAVINAYSFYRGGGVLVDGNWLSDERTETGELPATSENYSRAHNPRTVGRRNIPLTVRNCEFLNNRAGAGGAIYSNGYLELYSCNFAQNAAKRRSEATAPADGRRSRGNGGAVFGSFAILAANTIFANNEAGVVEETLDISLLDGVGSRGGAVFHAADDTYGFMQLLNCDFVHNSALSYPAICTLYPNRGGLNKTENPNMVVNSIFWGNEVRTIPAAEIVNGNKQVNFVTNYWDRNGETMAEELSMLADDYTDADGNPGLGEMLWFCAYENKRGCTPRFDDRNEIDYRTANYTTDTGINKYIPDVFANITYHKRNEATGEMETITVADNGAYRWVTNNIYLSADNNALDGPNFVNPSLGAGVNHYLPSADWMVSRQNNLTDNGWTRIEQVVAANNPDEPTSFTCDFVEDTDGILPARAHGIYADSRRALTEQEGSAVNVLMPLGEERYMLHTNGAPLYRISKDPNPSQYQTFIDLGVYEYQHTPLSPNVDDEVDILWVSTEEKPANGPADGNTWMTPTSDLQRAIETLLASRNNHHKQINIIEGSYSPIYTIDGHMSFTINTGSLNAAASLPEDRRGIDNGNFGVKSLTIKGGWSKDVEMLLDVEAYPTVLEMATRTGVSGEKMSTVFRISDAHNWYGVGGNSSTIPATDGNTLQGVIPVTIEGVTVQNTYGSVAETTDRIGEGAAIYYEPQYRFEMGTDGKPLTTEDGNYVVAKDAEGESMLADIPTDGSPKLRLGHSILRLNGTDKDVPAVTIAEGGGYTVVYNTLFHSNRGRSITANNTRVVNCTFALNGRAVRLLDDKAAGTQAAGTEPVLHSMLHNSLLWRNTAENQNDDPDDDVREFEIPALNTNYLTYNAMYGDVYTDGCYVNPDDGIIHLVVKGVDNATNHILSGTNSDVLSGPNFVNPAPESVVDSDRLLRDFHLRPSARTIDQGDDRAYAAWVYGKDELTAEVKAAETDLAFMPRFTSAHVDRGAYEFQGELQRVIYVDPTKMTSGSGASWASPYGYGQLQSAIDLAAVFHSINDNRAYVFCKGGQLTGELLTPRAGVNVYAGVMTDYTDVAPAEPVDDADDSDGGYAEEDLHDYIVCVLGDRPGIVTPNSARTGIVGVRTSGAYPTYALMDGFDIAPDATEVTAPVVDLGNGVEALPVVLRNSVIHGVRNTSVLTDDGAASAVRVRGGLLYNVLVRDCEATSDGVAATYIGLRARAVGCTFLGKGATGYALEVAEGDSPYRVSHFITWNPDRAEGDRLARLLHGGTTAGIANGNTEQEGYPFARYLQPVTDDNHPARPAVYLSQADLWYQLEENSPQLDYSGADFTEALYADVQTALGIKAAERPAVLDFARDRDLLGNPRLPKYHPAIDRGCFEAWNVPAGIVAGATYRYVGTRGSLAGGRRSPQEGSMVYLHKGATLVMSADDFHPMSTTAKGRNEVLRPGYLLLCEGASLYGEGAAVSLNHVGVEREVRADAGALVALPYGFDYAAARRITYDADGHVVQTLPGTDAEVCFYDGAARAGWNYVAVDTRSECWKPVDTTDRPRCAGVWYHPAVDGTYRFTAADVTADGSKPVYREGFYDNAVETCKTVELTQYDYRTMDGKQPQFTIAENMGWNLVGVPYLVSDYPTASDENPESFSPDDYPMSLPRFVYPADTDGRFLPNASWKAAKSGISPAVGFFTQTATIGTTETLTFRLPHYAAPESVHAAPRKVLALTDADGHTDEVTLSPDVEANELPAYTLGRDALQWSPLSTTLPEVYVPLSSGTRLAWLSSVPVGTDIPLGVSVSRGEQCRISLPEQEAWTEYSHIWLTDHITGEVTDLRQGDYFFDLMTAAATTADAPSAAVPVDHRFTLRIGGIRPDGGHESATHRYTVYGRDGQLVVERLTGDETIDVYDVAGRRITRTQTDGTSCRIPLPTAVYVVRINHQTYKARVR